LSGSTEPTLVPAHVNALALRLLDGWRPIEAAWTPLARFIWAEQDMLSSAGPIALRGDALDVTWTDETPLFMMSDAYKLLRNKAVKGTLADGRELRADNALFAANDCLRLHYWELSTPGRPSRLWVAAIQGLEDGAGFVTNGNLTVLRETPNANGGLHTRFSAGHYRLVGAYTYYLLHAGGDKREWFLIVDVGHDGPPERGSVFIDMLALQFALGRAFYFDVMHGLEGADIVSTVGGRHGRDQRHKPNAQPPVPLDFAAECWAAQLFEKVSAAYRSRPELRFYVALTFYLDAIATYHVEARYLALHVALESFAYWLLQANAPEERPLVDRAKWRAWLAANKESIKSLAAPDQGETLFAKITSIPARRAASRVVEDAFAHCRVALAAEMAAELEEGRGRIVHTASMFEQRQAQLQAYLTPIAVVRSMLVALVSRAAGYEGAILGWTREDGRPFDSADAVWWPVNDDARLDALRRFQVRE
jgi:hypothetical protein